MARIMITSRTYKNILNRHPLAEEPSVTSRSTAELLVTCRFFAIMAALVVVSLIITEITEIPLQGFNTV